MFSLDPYVLSFLQDIMIHSWKNTLHISSTLIHDEVNSTPLSTFTKYRVLTMADDERPPPPRGQCTGGKDYLDPLPILQKNPDFLKLCKGIRVYTGVRFAEDYIKVDGMWIEHASPNPATNRGFVLKAFVAQQLDPDDNAAGMTPATTFAVDLWITGGSHTSEETGSYYHCQHNNAQFKHLTIVTLDDHPFWCLGMVWIPFTFPSESKIRDWNARISRPHIPFPVEAMKATLRRVPNPMSRPSTWPNIVKLEDHPRQ